MFLFAAFRQDGPATALGLAAFNLVLLANLAALTRGRPTDRFAWSRAAAPRASARMTTVSRTPRYRRSSSEPDHAPHPAARRRRPSSGRRGPVGPRLQSRPGPRPDFLVNDASLEQAGEQAWNQALQQSKVSPDRAANARVRAVGQRVVDAAGLGGRPWDYAVFEGTAPNAFVLPGGHVGVTTGLLRIVDNDDQLAAVIGHEAGHVVARHAAERQSQNLTSSLVLGVLGAASGSSETARAISSYGATGAKYGFLLPFLAQAGAGGRPPGRGFHAAGRIPPARGGDPVAAYAGRRRVQLAGVHLDPPLGRLADRGAAKLYRPTGVVSLVWLNGHT